MKSKMENFYNYIKNFKKIKIIKWVKIRKN